MGTTFRWHDDGKYTPEQVRGLALGAIYLAQEGRNGKTDHCDDFDYTGMRFANRRSLKKAWGLTGRDDSLETMASLLNGMHGPEFDAILEILIPAVGSDDSQQRAAVSAVVETLGPGYQSDAINFLQALHLRQLPARFGSTYAWDLTRLAMLARRTVAAEWVDVAEVLPILEEATRRSRQMYSSWSDYGAGFTVGRALWASDGEFYSAQESLNISTVSIQDLTTEPTSPWVRLPW